MTQKLKILTLLVVVLASFITIIFSPPAYADDLKPGDCKFGLSKTNPQVCAQDPSGKDCPSGKVDKDDDSKCLPLGSNPVALKNNPIVKDLNKIVGVLSGLVGVVVVGVIILGGIQYSIAGDKAEAVSAAKKRITNGLIALIAFLFIFAFLQWLIPGGIFK